MAFPNEARTTTTSPFISAIYPDRQFWSLNQFLHKWELDHGEQFRVSVLDVLTLTHEHKEAFLQVALEKQRKAVPLARKRISRITELDTEIGQAFQTKASVIRATTVRMVRLQSSEKRTTTEASAVESFIALSYCWHTPEWEVVGSLREEQNSRYQSALPVSYKMWTALSILRSSTDEAVWVHQMCINQNNPIEKHNAIAGMDIIYESARLIVVPLEDIELSRYELRAWNRAAERLAVMSQNNAQYVPTEEEIQVGTNILNKLFSARWFSRAWCLQEYFVARDCVFLLPCDGDVVLIPSWKVMMTISFRYGITTLMQKPMLDIAHGFTYKFSNSSDHSVMDLFAQLTLRQSSITSDKLAILLNMLGLNVTYGYETATADDNCYVAVILVLAMGDGSPLCNDGGKLRLGANHSIKSWVQWPSINRNARNLAPLGDSTSLVFIGPDCLRLDLYILEGRRSISSDASKQRVLSFLRSEHGNLTTLISAVGLGQARAEDYAMALAAALELGLDWMAQSCPVGNFAIWHQEEYGVEKVIDKIKHIGFSVIEDLATGSDIEFATKAHKESLEIPVIRYIVRLLAYRLPLDSSISLDSAGHQATCPNIPPHIVLAVPADLANRKFSELNRDYGS
jgi:hypothetical protein